MSLSLNILHRIGQSPNEVGFASFSSHPRENMNSADSIESDNGSVFDPTVCESDQEDITMIFSHLDITDDINM